MSFTKTILIAILLISLVYVKNQDSCIASIQKSIYSFNSSNPDFSNPALASGTNLNDLGKYDACIKNVNMTYLLVNFPLPTGISEDLKNITLKVFIGLCAPKNSCENNQSYHEIAQFIVDKTNSSSLLFPHHITSIIEASISEYLKFINLDGKIKIDKKKSNKIIFISKNYSIFL